MKMNYRLTLAVTTLAALLVQPVCADDQPDASPAGTAPGVHPAKKKKAAPAKKDSASAKKAAATAEPDKPVPVTRGPAIVSQQNRNSVNVRGKPDLNSEVVARLKRGDHVNVLDLLKVKAKEDEPAEWAKISLPTNALAWVNASFVNADKTVKPAKLNVRSGPGENYSVVARIPKGTALKEIETKGEWMKIEPPADSYGYIAAHLLSPEPAVPAPPIVVASVEPPKPAPPPPTTVTKVPPPLTPVPATEPIVPPAPTPVTPTVVQPPPPPTVASPATPPAPAPLPAPVTPPATTPAAEVVAAPATPAAPVEETFVKRVVNREGFVKRSVSIQAPTYFALQSLDSGKTINYLYSPTTNLVLKDFTGRRIMVTGEELLDERWPNTPVINVDTLQAVP